MEPGHGLTERQIESMTREFRFCLGRVAYPRLLLEEPHPDSPWGRSGVLGNDRHPLLFTEAHQDDSGVDAVESQPGVDTNLKCKI